MLGDIRVAQLVSGLTIGAALLIMYFTSPPRQRRTSVENSLTTTANDPDLSKDISPSGNKQVLPDDTGSVNDTNQPSSPVASEALNDSSSAKEESEP